MEEDEEKNDENHDISSRPKNRGKSKRGGQTCTSKFEHLIYRKLLNYSFLEMHINNTVDKPFYAETAMVITMITMDDEIGVFGDALIELTWKAHSAH